MVINENQVRQWYKTMKDDHILTEIRILTHDSAGGKGPIYSGIFEDADSIVAALIHFEPEPDIVVKGTYFTLNRLKDDCRTLPQYGRIMRVYRTISDADIAHRDWILVDFDPVRPAGVSSTDDEKFLAYDVMRKVFHRCLPVNVEEFIIPCPTLIADSGNGYHLLWKFDAPNCERATREINQFLHDLHDRFSTDKVDIDTSVGNASRICKLYGTMACKGENAVLRPHRFSCFRLILGQEDENFIP